MKFHGNNEVFIENIRLARMSNDNSSPVFKNSGSRSNYFHWQLVQRQIAKLSRGVWARAIEYSRIRAVNQSLHYCSCGILTFPEEVLKFMDWLEFLICSILLMWQIAASKWGKDWNSYPKNRKSFRIQQYTIVESKTRPASPVIGSSTFICIEIGGSSIFFFCKSFNSAIRPITLIVMASNRILWFMCTCIPIWARGSLSLDSHNNSDIVDAGNLMYPSHGGTQAGRVQSDPTGDPFVCGQCSTTGQLSSVHPQRPQDVSSSPSHCY